MAPRLPAARSERNHRSQKMGKKSLPRARLARSNKREYFQYVVRSQPYLPALVCMILCAVCSRRLVIDPVGVRQANVAANCNGWHSLAPICLSACSNNACVAFEVVARALPYCNPHSNPNPNPNPMAMYVGGLAQPPPAFARPTCGQS